MRALLLLLTAAGCGRLEFEEPPRLDSVSHLPGNVEILGIGVLTIGDGTLDTDALTLGGAPLPVGRMVASPQNAGGPELALVDAYLVRITGEVHVVGSRALVIAAQIIDVSGTLDVGAVADQAGPGASDAASGTGAIGVHSGSVNDSGGGGGGHATPGGAGGGSSGTAGGAGGLVLGDPGLTILAGGGRGGEGIGVVCGNPPGGGGGGAVQLTAATRISISGRVLAGGGGGGGGLECMDNDAGSAGGGGAGGAIFLAAPSIVIDGLVVAHGGGGGGGGNGSSGNGPVATGMTGADGRTVEPASGGEPAASTSGAGGVGGTGDGAPGTAVDVVHNGGGGGGAAGRIVVLGEREGSGLVSPPDQR